MQDNQIIFNLLKGCLANNRSSQKGLYQMLRKDAYAIFYRYLDSKGLIEDLLNKSFIELFKHIDQFDNQKYPDIYAGVKGWLGRIVVNLCIVQYDQTGLFEHGIPGEISDPGAVYEGEGRTSGLDIIEAIRKLPPSCRIVYNLSVIEGMSPKEIGDRLGISASQSISIIDRAREIIRKNLSEVTTPTWSRAESEEPCSTQGSH